jgi:flagellar biosynthesis GTPase FlhF
VSNEVVKGTSVALSSKVSKAQKAYEETKTKTEQEKLKQEQYLEKRPVGRRPQFEKKIAKAKVEEEQALKELEETQENQEIVKTANANIGHVYHP